MPFVDRTDAGRCLARRPEVVPDQSVSRETAGA